MFLNQLADNLNEQVSAHEIILTALAREAKLSADCNLADLEEIHASRDQAVLKVKQLEELRIEITNYYCQKQGLETTTPLKEIIETSPGEIKDTLLERRVALKELIDDIAMTGKTVAARATARIACFDEVQGAIHKALNRSATYSMSGLIRKPRGACLVRRSI